MSLRYQITVVLAALIPFVVLIVVTWQNEKLSFIIVNLFVSLVMFANVVALASGWITETVGGFSGVPAIRIAMVLYLAFGLLFAAGAFWELAR
jgi:hypothetical protein